MSKGGCIKTKGRKLRLTDSRICFYGNSAKAAIKLKKGGLEAEDCEFFQEDSDGETFTAVISSKGDGSICMDNCTFRGFLGRWIQAVGTSVYVNGCRVSDLSGEFCNVCYDEKKEGVYPSLFVKDCSFQQCSFPEHIEYTRTKKNEPEYWDTKSPSVIDGHEIVNAEFENLEFRDCTLKCLRVQNTMLPNPCRLINSEFINCTAEVSDDYDSIRYEHEAFCVYFRKTNLIMKGCSFENTWPAYSHSQYSAAEITECSFKGCRIENGFRTGILYIFNEVDEPVITISECNFTDCVVEDRYEGGETAMIYIGAGAPTRSQAETVLVEKCKYIKCSAAKNICGKVKQDGLFGRTIVLYREE